MIANKKTYQKIEERKKGNQYKERFKIREDLRAIRRLL